MEVGSLVESTINFTERSIHNEILPVKGVIYTIREIEHDDDWVGIRLEEIVNAPHFYRTGDNAMRFIEVSFLITRFRELQSPMKEVIKELLEQPELV